MDLEEERKAEAELLQDAKERLAQLEVANQAEAIVSAPPAPPPTRAQEMEFLKARLSSVDAIARRYDQRNTSGKNTHRTQHKPGNISQRDRAKDAEQFDDVLRTDVHQRYKQVREQFQQDQRRGHVGERGYALAGVCFGM